MSREQHLQTGPERNVHDTHPSLAMLAGRGDVAKLSFEERAAQAQATLMSERRTKTPHDLQSGRIRAFSKQGDTTFRVLVDNLQQFSDKDCTETCQDSVYLEKESVVPGTYINQHVVFIHDPYNVYIDARDVEPCDLQHGQFNMGAKDSEMGTIPQDDEFQDIDDADDDLFQPMQAPPTTEAFNPYPRPATIPPPRREEAPHRMSATPDAPPPDYTADPAPPPMDWEPSPALAEEIASDPQLSRDPYLSVHSSGTAPAHTDSFLVDVDQPVASGITTIPDTPTSPALQTKPPPPPRPTQPQDNESGVRDLPTAHSIASDDFDYDDMDLDGDTAHETQLPKPPPARTDVTSDSHYDVQHDAHVTQYNQPEDVAYDQYQEQYQEEQYQEEEEHYDEEKAVEIGSGPPPPPPDAYRPGGRARTISRGGSVFVSTGDLLEDCDNILRIYRTEYNAKNREELYLQFWASYDEMTAARPRELLKVPCQVRGLLTLIRDWEPYRADQIMREVLSKNGLLTNPDYIDNRWLFKIFVTSEFWNYFGWFWNHMDTLRGWMFFFSFLLTLAVFIHIGVDFGRGDVWRALLMEFLLPFTAVSTIIFVDTPFTANVIRTKIENKAASLATISGRMFYNGLIGFFCLGSWTIKDTALVFCAILVCGWTSLMFYFYDRLKNVSAYVRLATGKEEKLKEKFLQFDTDRDGILSRSELYRFFDSYRQTMRRVELEMMILQYDIHRDGGLRYDSLRIWFEHLPVHAQTRTKALAGISKYTGPTVEEMAKLKKGAFSRRELEVLETMGGSNQPNKDGNDVHRPSQLQAHNLAFAAMGASTPI